MARKSAADSVQKLSKGLSRETPATRSEKTASTAAERPGRSASSERKVRVSVDLPRSEHKYLRDVAYDAESDAMSVMRALLSEMADDPELAERVRDRLAGE